MSELSFEALSARYADEDYEPDVPTMWDDIQWLLGHAEQVQQALVAADDDRERLNARIAELESRPISAPPAGRSNPGPGFPLGRNQWEDGQHPEDEPLSPVAKRWPTQAEIDANHKRLNTADSPDPLPTAEAGIDREDGGTS
jgi:hypothetical protein